MVQSHGIKFIINGEDYFSLYTDNKEIRIGLKNCGSINIPFGHCRYDDALNCKNEIEIENLFDELFTF